MAIAAVIIKCAEFVHAASPLLVLVQYGGIHVHMVYMDIILVVIKHCSIYTGFCVACLERVWEDIHTCRSVWGFY